MLFGLSGFFKMRIKSLLLRKCLLIVYGLPSPPPPTAATDPLARPGSAKWSPRILNFKQDREFRQPRTHLARRLLTTSVPPPVSDTLTHLAGRLFESALLQADEDGAGDAAMGRRPPPSDSNFGSGSGGYGSGSGDQDGAAAGARVPGLRLSSVLNSAGRGYLGGVGSSGGSSTALSGGRRVLLSPSLDALPPRAPRHPGMLEQLEAEEAEAAEAAREEAERHAHGGGARPFKSNRTMAHHQHSHGHSHSPSSSMQHRHAQDPHHAPDPEGALRIPDPAHVHEEGHHSVMTVLPEDREAGGGGGGPEDLSSASFVAGGLVEAGSLSALQPSGSTSGSRPVSSLRGGRGGGGPDGAYLDLDVQAAMVKPSPGFVSAHIGRPGTATGCVGGRPGTASGLGGRSVASSLPLSGGGGSSTGGASLTRNRKSLEGRNLLVEVGGPWGGGLGVPTATVTTLYNCTTPGSSRGYVVL